MNADEGATSLSPIDELIALADSILMSAESMDDAVVTIENYAATFETWCQANSAIFAESPADGHRTLPQNAFTQEELDKLRLLLEKHGQVLEKANSLKDATARQIRDHRVKGKGIMAYLDRLPKSLSTRKPKKG